MLSQRLLIIFVLVPHCYMIRFFKPIKTVKQPQFSVDSVEVPNLNDEAEHQETKGSLFKSRRLFSSNVNERVQKQLSEDFNAVQVMHTLATTSLRDPEKKPVNESHFPDSVEVSRKAEHHETEKSSHKSDIFSSSNINEIVQIKLAEDFETVNLLPTPPTESIHNPEEETLKETEVPNYNAYSSKYLPKSSYVMTYDVNKAQLQQIEEFFSNQAIRFSLNLAKKADNRQETKSANNIPSNVDRRVHHQLSQEVKGNQFSSSLGRNEEDSMQVNRNQGGLIVEGDYKNKRIFLNKEILMKAVDAVPVLNPDTTASYGHINLVSPVELQSDSPPLPSLNIPALTTSQPLSASKAPRSQPRTFFKGNLGGPGRFSAIKKETSTPSSHKNIQKISYKDLQVHGSQLVSGGGEQTLSYSSFSRSPQAVKFTRLSSEFDLVAKKAGTDPVARVKDLADGLIQILRDFASNKDAVKFVKDNSEESSCIASFDDAISATKSASEIISNASTELKAFLNTYESLKDEKDVFVLIKGTATMLEQLDVIIPKLSKFSLSTRCRVSSKDNLRGLEELSSILTNMAYTKTIAFQQSVRDYLKRSAIIVNATVSFLKKIRSSLGNLNNKFCSSDSEGSNKGVTAIGDMFEEVVEYLVAVGSDFDIEEIRENNIAFTERLVASVEAIRKRDLGFLPCNSELSYKETAKTLRELAVIIEEIGFDVLSKDPGIDFDLGFDIEPVNSVTFSIEDRRKVRTKEVSRNTDIDQESPSPTDPGLQPAPVVKTRQQNKLKSFYSKSVVKVTDPVRKSPSVSSQVRVIDWDKYDAHSQEPISPDLAEHLERALGILK